MITPEDILHQHVADNSTMTWRELAAIHIHAGLVTSEYYRGCPEGNAKMTIQHVNALAAELARTQVPVSTPSS